MKYLTIVAGLILCCAPARAQCGAGGKLIINGITGLPDCTGLTGAGSGTVTSVGESFTGGLISVSGSPVIGAGTLALTVAGTSGGIPYFSGAATWATSAALTAHGVVVGGGAATAPASTAAGTAGQVLTSNGSGADPTFQAGGSGTVTSASVTTANGVSATVATATTTPAFTFTLGAITPTTIVASGLVTASAFSSGTSPPAVTPGTGGGEAFAEGTVPSVGAAAGVDICYGDSTQHGILCSRNNGSYLPIPQGPASTTSGHIASWNSTNGGLLADGGVLGTAAAVSSTCSGTDLTGTLPGCTIVAASVTAAKMVNSGVFTGDVTTTFPAITVAKVNGIAYSATAAAHSVEVITTANTTATAKAIPDCPTGGVSFTQSTDAFGCNSITGAVHGIGASFQNSGSALVSGATAYFTVPYGCTIQAWNIAITPADTATFKVWKIATGTAIPTVSNSINTSGVAISTGTAVHSTTLSDFTSTTVTANDIFGINLLAVGGTATQANFVLQCT